MAKLLFSVLVLCCGTGAFSQALSGDSSSASQFNVQNAVNNVLGSNPNVVEPNEIMSMSRQGRRTFADIDNAVERDENEQNFRSLFGNEQDNEFVRTDDAAMAALRTEAQAAKFVNSTGMNVTQSFDANGKPLSQEVARVALQASKAETCVWDKANSDPCTSVFREPTGRCSHVDQGRRTWGMAGTPFSRILPSKYEDGISSYRTTELGSGNPLESARKISDTVTNTAILLHRDFSAQLMQWGQFMAHEFTLIGELEENIECCPDKIFHKRFGDDVEPTPAQLEEIREEVRRLRGHVCIAIENENDSVFGEHICMQQTRSTIAPTHDCTPGPRQQANTITHLMDASAVYGSSQKESNDLRSFQGGRMKVQVVDGHILPPADTSKCPAQQAAQRCPFLGGDNRINTTPNLISMHTAFLVFHNKIADELSSINSHWDDERLYQETRRIVSGIQSSIHYKEFLPLIIGEDLTAKWLTNYNGFESDTNPSVLNELAGAAFRFGHSIIDGIFFVIDEEGQRTHKPLRENFFNHTLVYELGATQHLRGLQRIAPWKVDNHFPTEMRDHLFDQQKDIVSFNINRGRDHGFASYNDYRRFYNLSVASTWEELRQTHSDVVVNNLKEVYTTVEDVELYIGGVTENSVNTGIVGDLFGNIMGHGFANIRNGDRLFYASNESGLTQDQIAAIDGVSLAQLLCEGGGLSHTSSKAFFQPNSRLSENVTCSTFSEIDLNLWKEEDNTQTCEWQVVEISKCCLGTKTITRECLNRSNQCQCEGSPILVESCDCPPSDYICLIDQVNCFFDVDFADYFSAVN